MTLEHYIPFDKELILEKLLGTSAIAKKHQKGFERLFNILEHYFHYEAFILNQELKRNYAAFDPDRNLEERKQFEKKSKLSRFKETLEEVLSRGNYTKISEDVLKEAIEASDLVGLQLEIDFKDFKEYTLYARGLTKTTEKVKRLFFWTKEIEIEYYERVMVFLHYNDASHFEQKKLNLAELPFDPNCVVLKVFKRVPKNDLETIFPNAEPRMSLMDKLFLWVPGVGGGIPLLSAKVIPALIAIYAAYKSGESLSLGHGHTALIQGLVALGVLGGYLFRQYTSYVTKKIKFAKLLSDSLYFKNLGNNSGVFHSLLDGSEEEELKEAILAYSFLLKSPEPLTAKELDNQVETWFKVNLNKELDFDVSDALQKLKDIGLGSEQKGKWIVLPLEKALKRVDEIWDNIFNYH